MSKPRNMGRGSIRGPYNRAGGRSAVANRDPWRPVASVMAAGALYDLAFAVAILAATRPSARLLGLTVPDDPVYLALDGVFLLLLAGLYALAALDPRRYTGIPPVSAAGRALGCAVLVWAWLGGRPPAFLVLGLADLALAALTAALWNRARRTAPNA